MDAALEQDTGSSLDAGGSDAAEPDALQADALISDTLNVDAIALDAVAPDALSGDATVNDTLATDAISTDGLPTDAMTPQDAMAPDAMAPDATPLPDAAPLPDAGAPGMGDIWVQIDYSHASSPQSPDWSFSNTPGWGPAQWAMTGATYPEAWDRFNNMQVVADPIGQSLEIGSGSQLQLLIGLVSLMNYQSAIVHLEGRSRSTDAPVSFDITNPLNQCGNSGMMSQDWTVHLVDVDLAQCMLVGQGVQAVRVDPQDGTIALVRLRLTLYGASW
jgi:hypothetical protein